MNQPIDGQIDVLQIEEIGESEPFGLGRMLGKGPSILLPRYGIFGEVDHPGNDRAGQ